MEVDENWRGKPITKKQIEFLCNITCESLNSITRGEASDLIHNLLESREKYSYNHDVLEDNK